LLDQGRKNKWILLLGMLISFSAFAEETRPSGSDPLLGALQSKLEKRFSGARIEMVGAVQWTHGKEPSEIKSIQVLSENARGEVQFEVQGEDYTVSYGWASFRAWIPAYFANRRVMPGEKIAADTFRVQELNVVSPQAFDFRGSILDKDSDLTKMEARQTILEGQFLISSAVQRIPDVRRGDSVQIRMFSGTLNITTASLAEEPAYVDNRVKVLTSKTKRELVGQLRKDGVVEVRL
jgi:flagella basal body P-ring formation protein FlgA